MAAAAFWLGAPSSPPRTAPFSAAGPSVPTPPRAVVCMISVTVCVSVRGASGEPGWETASGVGQVSKAQTQALAQAASPFPGSATQGSHIPTAPLPLPSRIPLQPGVCPLLGPRLALDPNLASS